MNYNVIAYSIYLSLTVFIIVYVGRLFHRHGRVFILGLFRGDDRLTDYINNLLLLAYYLFNIGYAFLRLRNWAPVENPSTLISTISHHLGKLTLILAGTHYFNMFMIYHLSKSRKIFLHS